MVSNWQNSGYITGHSFMTKLLSTGNSVSNFGGDNSFWVRLLKQTYRFGKNLIFNPLNIFKFIKLILVEHFIKECIHCVKQWLIKISVVISQEIFLAINIKLKYRLLNKIDKI